MLSQIDQYSKNVSVIDNERVAQVSRVNESTRVTSGLNEEIDSGV
jgi:hypothetical protein